MLAVLYPYMRFTKQSKPMLTCCKQVAPGLFSAQPRMLHRIRFWHRSLASLASCPFQRLATPFDLAPSLSSWSTHHVVSFSPVTTRSIFTITDGAELELVVCVASKEAMCWQRGCKARNTARLECFPHSRTCLVQHACMKSA